MTNQIQFYFIRKVEHYLHSDFSMCISKVNFTGTFDSYYFALGKEISSTSELILILSDYLDECKKSILKIEIEKFIYIPIDLSDQYYGFFKVTKKSENLFMFEYGAILKTDKVKYEEPCFLKIENIDIDFDFELILRKEEVEKSFTLLIQST